MKHMNYSIILASIFTTNILFAMESKTDDPASSALLSSYFHHFHSDHLQLIEQELQKKSQAGSKTDRFLLDLQANTIPMFMELVMPDKMVFPANWHSLSLVPLAALDDDRDPQRSFQHIAFTYRENNSLTLKLYHGSNPLKETTFRNLDDGELLLDGPNNHITYICASNSKHAESHCYLLKPNLHGTIPQHKITIPRIPHDAITAVALGNKDTFAIATCYNMLMYRHTEGTYEQCAKSLTLPKAFKKMAFITASTLLCLDEAGDLYTCWKDQTILKTVKQKMLAPIETFAVDSVNPWQIVFLKKYHNYDDPIYYCNLKERTKDGKIPYILLKSNFNNPQHEIKQLWFYNGTIGLLIKATLATGPQDQLLKQTVSCVTKKQFLDYANKTLNPDIAKLPA